MKLIRLFYFVALIAIAFSCKKNNDFVDPNSEGEIEFNIAFSSEDFKSATLKAGSTLNDAKKIVLTIQKANGEATKYTSQEINIYKIGGSFFSQKLSLTIGDYRLMEFFLIDENDNAIYVTPITGSLQAQNIDNPLPLDFSITKDQITSLTVELVSTEGLTPEDFGLVMFPFSEIETFSFLVNVSEQGNMDNLLTASLDVTSDTYSYSQELEAIATNIVTVKAGYSEYTIDLTKDGYDSYSHTHALEDLLQYQTEPLTIELSNVPAIILTDIDGNTYRTVKIGEQFWMAENLKVTHYNDGTEIPLVISNTEWSNTVTPAYCWYNNQESFKDLHGALYNWYAVETNKLCPSGWHVPTDTEWKTLEMEIGMSITDVELSSYRGTDEGLKLKSTQGWNQNENGYDTYGFSALPTGYRFYFDSVFYKEGATGFWWTSTEQDNTLGIKRAIDGWYTNIGRHSTGKGSGVAIRCVMD